MTKAIPKLIILDAYKEEPKINMSDIKELLDYAEAQAEEKENLLDFAELLWTAKGAITAAIRTSASPSGNLHRLYGILETVETITNERILLYKFAEVSDIPMAEDTVCCIYCNQGLRDEQIAEKLNVDVESLKKTLDELFTKEIITFTRPGEWKYYYLTRKGNRYYEECVLPF